MENVIPSLVVLLVGVGAGWMLRQVIASKRAEAIIEESSNVLEQAKRAAETIAKEAEISAKETMLTAQSEAERKIAHKKRELEQFERRLLQREGSLDGKLDQVEKRDALFARREAKLQHMEKNLERKHERANRFIEEQTAKLQEISGITTEQAKTELKERFYEQARLEAAHAMKKTEEEALSKATDNARNIIANAIQRCASDFVAENTVSVVDLPNEEMKGRIIGREGRNIRALEIATGVDLIIDDTPNAVILSCFDMVKREIARLTLERLIHDGRIHPGRIEDTVEKVTKEINVQMKKESERACLDMGLDGIHQEIVKLLGRLKYRTSYSQNVLNHSVEVGFLSGMMAAELGQNVKLARRAGLLHDLGKALDQNMEGSHTQIGADVARRFNEPGVVVNAIESHHEDVPPTSIIAVLVAASDALSASRPGARREMLQTYINRMQKLEEIGNSFSGVEKTYAIQAGREIRVVVEPETIRDSEVFFLAKDIARKIESELAYPGEIKVTVIRETRVVEAAR